MTYNPQVDDYVIWNRPNGDIEEGWVYFVGDKLPKKRGFNESPQYITIEVAVRDKHQCQYSNGKSMLHKKIHTLLLCYAHDWKDLEYVKNRRDIEEKDNVLSMYKSQDRPLDIDSYGAIPPRY